MWFSLLGLLVTVVLNVLFVPRFGYMACAWAAFASYGTMMLASYFIGRSKYPIGYDIKGIFRYFVIAIVLYVTASLVKIEPEWAGCFSALCCSPVMSTSCADASQSIRLQSCAATGL